MVRAPYPASGGAFCYILETSFTFCTGHIVNTLGLLGQISRTGPDLQHLHNQFADQRGLGTFNRIAPGGLGTIWHVVVQRTHRACHSLAMHATCVTYS